MRTHPAHMHTISKPVHDMAWTPQPGGYCTVRPSMMMVSVPVCHPTRIPLDHVAWNSTFTVASVAWCLSVHAGRFLQTLWDSTVCSVWSAPWLRSVVSHLAFLVAGRTEGWKCGEHGSASSAKSSFIVPGLQQLIGTAST